METHEIPFDLMGLRTPQYVNLSVDGTKTWKLWFGMKTDEKIVKNVWAPVRPGQPRKRTRIIKEKPVCVKVSQIPSKPHTMFVANEDAEALAYVQRVQQNATPDPSVVLKDGTTDFTIRLDIRVPVQGKAKGTLYINLTEA